VRVDLGANNITIRSPLTINGSFVVDSAGMIVNDTSLTINGALHLDIDNSSCTLSSFLSQLVVSHFLIAHTRTWGRYLEQRSASACGCRTTPTWSRTAI
jgi:hypothetical protein